MLDIIIPTYKDPEGLRRTLKSVYYPEQSDWITITVVDDCSPIKYDEIEADYPTITFHHLPENHGPGYARQYGIDHTLEPYFIFVDCGDILYFKFALMAIKDMIESHPNYYLFQWAWILENGRISSNLARSTQGWVYRRSMFDTYSIRFCTDQLGGRADEDVGYNHVWTTIIKHMEIYDNKQYSAYCEMPIYKKIRNDESITNTGHYYFEKHIPGLTINAKFCMNQLEQTNLSLDILIEELNILFFNIYEAFIDCAKRENEYTQRNWEYIRKFYSTVYKKYETSPLNEEHITQCTSRFMERLQRKTNHINIRRFIRELNDCEEYPSHYKE